LRQGGGGRGENGNGKEMAQGSRGNHFWLRFGAVRVTPGKMKRYAAGSSKTSVWKKSSSRVEWFYT
jgi:hypothetical protein